MPDETSVPALMHQAIQAELTGRFADAIAGLRQVVGQAGSPLALDAQLRLGKLLIQARQLDEAETILNEARKGAQQQGMPRKAAAAGNLLALLERRRNPDLAMRLLDANA